MIDREYRNPIWVRQDKSIEEMAKNPEYIIEVNHVSKQFEDGKFALNDVSLQVKKGESSPF